mgnify:CR=1 FL=1
MSLAWFLSMKEKFQTMTMYLADIKGAFLNAKMKDDEVILAQPPPEWTPTTQTKGRVVWKLKKALYGLKSSQKRWQQFFDELMVRMKFVSHPHDGCAYVKKVGRAIMIVCCHVDDLLVIGEDAYVAEFFRELKMEVDVTCKEVQLNESTTYLGRRLERRENEVIFGVDTKYVQNILRDNGMGDLKGTTEIKWEKEKEKDRRLDKDTREI